jgi:hypothetical protein
MSVHTVVESLAAFAAVRDRDPKGERVWWTTSPFLLMELPRRGETVRSPQEGLDQVRSDALAMAAREASVAVCDWLDADCSWRDYVEFRLCLGLQLFRCLFLTFYKGWLLSRVLEAAAGEPVECVGAEIGHQLGDLSMGYGRFDTLFYQLARRWPQPGPAAVPGGAPDAGHAEIERAVRHRPLGRSEKILSLLNHTPGALMFKVWKALARGRRGLLRSICLWPVPRRRFHILRDSELVHEAFCGLLRRGASLRFLDRLPGADPGLSGPGGFPAAETAMAVLRESMRGRMLARGLDWSEAHEACLGMAGERLCAVLEAMRGNLPALTAGFAASTARMRAGDEVLTSTLGMPVEYAFYCFCRSRGIRVTVVDHGVTLGLSEWSRWEASQAAMLAADKALYHCRKALEATRPHAPGQEGRVVGMARTAARVALPSLQRRLGRRLLGVGQQERVVMYVSELDYNNFQHGPHIENDLQYLRKTCQVVSALCRAFPASRVVLKLYPTQRYMDNHDFSDLAAEHPNLRIARDVDFRFIRAAVDLIFVSSTQSTLGWVAGSGVPFVYLDLAWSPGLIRGLRLDLPGIDGLTAAVIPDAGEVCSHAPQDVAAVLMERD